MNKLFLLALLLYFGGNTMVQSSYFTITNKCNQTVWPGVYTEVGVMSSTGFTLAAGETRSLKAPDGWHGRFWARTGCTFNNSGRGNCTTGDCGSNQIECGGATSKPPATLVEFKLDGASGKDFYDVSLVDGFNVPVAVVPIGATGSCPAIGCTDVLMHTCPAELKIANDSGCNAPCQVFNMPEYCCTGAFSSRNACQPNAYSKIFKAACPKAYSYQYDDATSTFTCSGSDYTITFCADSIPASSKDASIPSPAPRSNAPSLGPQETTPPHSVSKHSNNSSKLAFSVLIILFLMILLLSLIPISVSGIVLLSACMGCCLIRFMRRREKKRNDNIFGEFQPNDRDREDDLHLPALDFSTIADATNNFSDENKLGEGGFGPVYKGKLNADQDIAVKRLSKTSHQGVTEFKNEVMLIAKLQHRNLVRLLGCCIQGEERMLIYEYMLNKSLDAFLFDKEKAILLDWNTRYRIIKGVTHGLLYLHHDSRLRIIHRDLKASNILLDEGMNPKISDFGLARMFVGDETDFNTRKVVGTYGYMSPEYALDGNFSMKSDVFSYGVLVLEIISGKKNRGVYVHSPYLNLVAHAWSLWNEGRSAHLVDECISHSIVMNEVLKCFKIGLLCVQEYAEDRPLMSTVIQMFGSDISSLPEPKKSGFIARVDPHETNSSSRKQTVNEITITLLDGR